MQFENGDAAPPEPRDIVEPEMRLGDAWSAYRVGLINAPLVPAYSLVRPTRLR